MSNDAGLAADVSADETSGVATARHQLEALQLGPGGDLPLDAQAAVAAAAAATSCAHNSSAASDRASTKRLRSSSISAATEMTFVPYAAQQAVTSAALPAENV
eukprot:12836-Heterococcus_DN1.PRE.7